MDFGTGDGSKAKAWRDIWGSGQGIGAIDAVLPAGDYVARLIGEYPAAKARICGSGERILPIRHSGQEGPPKRAMRQTTAVAKARPDDHRRARVAPRRPKFRHQHPAALCRFLRAAKAIAVRTMGTIRAGGDARGTLQVRPDANPRAQHILTLRR